LRKHTADPDPRVRVAVAEALGACGDPTSLAALVPLLADPHPDVRRAAANSLGCLGDPRAAGPLAAALSQPDQPLLVRRALASALARAPHPEAQPTLAAVLNDPDPQVRGFAAQALGQVGNEAVYEELAVIRKDASPLLHGTVGDLAQRAVAMLERRGRRAAGR